MRLLYLSVYEKNLENEHYTETVSANSFSMFSLTHKKRVLDVLQYITKTILEKSQGKDKATIIDKPFEAHILKSNTKAIILVSEGDYPKEVAHRLLLQLLASDDFTSKVSLEDALKSYQDPNTDKIYKAKISLEETKKILTVAVSSLFERGEKLETLIERTTALTDQSKNFYKKAKETNKLCPWFYFW